MRTSGPGAHPFGMRTRTLTLLFTDMVGSTALAAHLPAREAERVRREHAALLVAEVERHGGRVIKNLGDGVMATFVAARAACAAATAAQQVVACRPIAGVDTGVLLRVGISTGDVEPDGGDWFGPAAVEASRLCARAGGGQVLMAESTRHAAGRGAGELVPLGCWPLKGLPEPTTVWEVVWSRLPVVRAVIADDTALVREGIARVLESHGIEVVAQAGDATELLELVAALRPHLAIVDVRMPPTHTDEGIAAAEHIRRAQPATAVLVLSQECQPRLAQRLLAASETSVGYLLKERVADLGEFAATARRIANGDVVIDPLLVSPRPVSD